MNHSFNVEVATKYGVEEAIVLENMLFWLVKNKANKKHIIDGNVWTYNSQQALAELFPYMNRSKVQRVMSKLEKEGLILKANYNVAKYDKTTWYALTSLGYSLFKMNSALLDTNNRTSQSEQPIPDIKPVINTNKEIEIKSVTKKIKLDVEKTVNEYTSNELLKTTIFDFLDMRRKQKDGITDKAITKMLTRLTSISKTDDEKIEILDNSTMCSYKGIFPLKENKQAVVTPTRNKSFGSAY